MSWAEGSQEIAGWDWGWGWGWGWKWRASRVAKRGSEEAVGQALCPQNALKTPSGQTLEVRDRGNRDKQGNEWQWPKQRFGDQTVFWLEAGSSGDQPFLHGVSLDSWWKPNGGARCFRSWVLLSLSQSPPGEKDGRVIATCMLSGV